ncbi:MAG: sensor histidine kinase [Pseudomonadota bacterium]
MNSGTATDRKNLAVDIDDQHYHSPVRANESALALLIRIVLANAARFSESGSTIHIKLDQQSLTIEDDGPGIAPQDRSRVFDRFYRAPDAKVKQGSGLGLAVAKWVAEAHGFVSEACSPLRGSGASVRLWFNQ